MKTSLLIGFIIGLPLGYLCHYVVWVTKAKRIRKNQEAVYSHILTVNEYRELRNGGFIRGGKEPSNPPKKVMSQLYPPIPPDPGLPEKSVK